MIQYFASKQDLREFKQEMSEFKDEMHEFKNEVLTVLDQQTVILRRLDEERVFGSERVNKLEKRVDNNEQDITELKIKVASI
ncbi:MAG: hypothetical protein NTU97_04585 [Candidatus Magasanikbacteria bacterium]|nr:hypothetical protein [Candidatus Magasanikbacteria bacterium]